MNDYQLKRFLRITTRRWGRLIAKRDDVQSRFVNEHRVGKGRWHAMCQWWVPKVVFNMSRCRLNTDNLRGLEALVIHEVCHIIHHDELTAPHDGKFEQIENLWLKLADLEDEKWTLKNKKESVCR